MYINLISFVYSLIKFICYVDTYKLEIVPKVVAHDHSDCGKICFTEIGLVYGHFGNWRVKNNASLDIFIEISTCYFPISFKKNINE